MLRSTSDFHIAKVQVDRPTPKMPIELLCKGALFNLFHIPLPHNQELVILSEKLLVGLRFSSAMQLLRSEGMPCEGQKGGEITYFEVAGKQSLPTTQGMSQQQWLLIVDPVFLKASILQQQPNLVFPFVDPKFKTLRPDEDLLIQQFFLDMEMEISDELLHEIPAILDRLFTFVGKLNAG